MTGVYLLPNGSYTTANLYDPLSAPLIPVPSKLYTSLLSKSEYPLAGYRFALKDIFDLNGVHTGAGSRAYIRTYPTRNATAPAIQTLLDAGAVVVGKTKSSQFAFGEWPQDHIDVPYPWNPRADKYLGLSASSIGSASAIAGYDFLDFTIGSDTGGSVRNPADRVGVYG
jgi:Asp-tRNA(Asn)/Glu-tRNA(Gln) amidotransferase A subunit family amidase